MRRPTGGRTTAERPLDERLAALDREFAEFKRGARAATKNWLSAVLGRFKGDADFDEIARAGADIRATGRLPNERAPDEGAP